LIGEYDDNGIQLRSYGWAPQSQWSTDPLFVKQDGNYYWYLNDHQGTPQQIIDTSGKVVWSAVYDSFGNCQIQTAEIVNNLRFAGQYHDAESGLSYNLNRYYDPTTGRYLRTDPFGEGLNLYAYVFNNPSTLIDPLGLCVAKAVGGFLKGVGSAAFELVYQTLATVYDLEQIIYALITGDLDSYEATSAIGIAAERGSGTIDILIGMAVGVVNVPVEFVKATWSGDAERIGSASFNLGLLLYGGAKGVAKLGRLKTTIGPLKQWIRVGPSYSKAAGQKILKSIRWGASPVKGGKYLKQIGSPTLRRFNQWLRSLKLPGKSWRVKDPGHFHLKK